MKHSVQTSNTKQHQTVCLSSPEGCTLQETTSNHTTPQTSNKAHFPVHCLSGRISDAVIKLHEFCAGPFEMTFQNLSGRLWRISRCLHHMLRCSKTCHRGCCTATGDRPYNSNTHQRRWVENCATHTYRHQRPWARTGRCHTSETRVKYSHTLQKLWAKNLTSCTHTYTLLRDEKLWTGEVSIIHLIADDCVWQSLCLQSQVEPATSPRWNVFRNSSVSYSFHVIFLPGTFWFSFPRVKIRTWIPDFQSSIRRPYI